jgi:hypothetical protein
MPEVLIGVLVGWSLATSAEIARWWWRSRQSDRERKTAIRLAARLTLEDLRIAEKATRKSKRNDPFEFDFFKRKLPTNTWNHNRDILAVAPEADADWETIALAFARIDELNWAMEPGERSLWTQEALLKEIPKIHKLVVKAEQTLARLSEG